MSIVKIMKFKSKFSVKINMGGIIENKNNQKYTIFETVKKHLQDNET